MENRTPMEVLLDGVTWESLPEPPEPPSGLFSAVPVATHRGELMLAGIKLRVFRLSDGRRVVDQGSILDLLMGLGGGCP